MKSFTVCILSFLVMAWACIAAHAEGEGQPGEQDLTGDWFFHLCDDSTGYKDFRLEFGIDGGFGAGGDFQLTATERPTDFVDEIPSASVTGSYTVNTANHTVQVTGVEICVQEADLECLPASILQLSYSFADGNLLVQSAALTALLPNNPAMGFAPDDYNCPIGYVPPQGENLIADPSFEAPLVSTPWEAASGLQSLMLCPTGGCGDCFRRSGQGLLRFPERVTADVWAIQQTVMLPGAARYELELHVAGCNGAPVGNLSVSLSGMGSQTINLTGAVHDEYQRHFLTFTPSNLSGGAATLTIGNGALGGANVAIDDVRLVARNDGDTCGSEIASMGSSSTSCDGVRQSNWSFNADGTFSLISTYNWDEGEVHYLHGTYCTDAGNIYMHLNRYCHSSDEVLIPEPGQACSHEAGEDCMLGCGALDLDWNAQYTIDNGTLSVVVPECEGAGNVFPCSLLNIPPDCQEGEAETTEGACDGDCTPEAESGEAETGDGEFEEDPNLTGDWHRCEDYGSGYYYTYGWRFGANGEYSYHNEVYQDEWYTISESGNYTVTPGAEPAITFSNRRVCISGDFIKSEGEGDGCSSPAPLTTTYSVSEGTLVTGSHPGKAFIREAVACGELPVLDPNLLGQWSHPNSGCNDVEASYGWAFNEGGYFRESYSEGEGDILIFIGTYAVDTSTTPRTIELHYLHYSLADDAVEEEYEADGCEEVGGFPVCFPDIEHTLDVTLVGTYQFEEGDLLLAVGECLNSIDGAQRYVSGDITCTSTEGTSKPMLYGYPNYELPPCGEGEGGGEGECKKSTADIAALVEKVAGPHDTVIVNGKPWTLGTKREKGGCPLPNDQTNVLGTWANADASLEVGNGPVVIIDVEYFDDCSGWHYEVRKGHRSVDTSVCPNKISYYLRQHCEGSDSTGSGNGSWCDVISESYTANVYMVDSVLYVAEADTGQGSPFSGLPDRFTRSGDCIPEGAAPAVTCEGETAPAPFARLWGSWDAWESDGPGHLTWTFTPDGTFSWQLEVNAGVVKSASGTFQVTGATSPHTITLHSTQSCDFTGDGEACTAVDVTTQGEVAISGDPWFITLNPHDCAEKGYPLRWECGDNCSEGETIADLPPDWEVPQTCESEEAETSEAEGGEGEAEETEAETAEAEGGDGEAELREAEAGEAEDTEAEESGPAAAIEQFGAVDADESGTLNEAEAGTLGIGSADFQELDLNGDGEITPAELMFAAGAESPTHSGDTNLDKQVSLSELLRVIQLYNAGGYACAPNAESEDGYEPSSAKGEPLTCPAHASDYAPSDGVLSLSEILRAIQLYNSGVYSQCDDGGEDGFCLN